MRAGWVRAVLLVALAVAPRVAFAEDPAPAPPPLPKPETPAPRIHSAHTVDVIAPGEKVETIIERLRGRIEHAPPVAPGGGEKVAPPPGGKGGAREHRAGAPEVPGRNRGGPPKMGPGSGPPTFPGGMRPPGPPGGGMTPPPLPPAPPPPLPPHP